MQNFIQPGNTIDVTAPRDLNAGDGCVVGKIFGVSANKVKSGQTAQLSVEGVFAFVKAGGVTPTEGGAINFDETTQTVVATGGKLIGYCVEGSSPDKATECWVKLIPTPV
jgi:predicted RecA/RadA family phage recombinase